LSFDDAGLLQLTQPGGQLPRRDSAARTLQIGKPHWPLEQIAHDEEAPALADELEGAGKGAEVGVGTL
jgi:hypothetical protein